MTFQKEMIRLELTAYQSYQELRIKLKNQIRDVVRKTNEGIAFNEVEEKKEEKDYSKNYTDDQLDGIMEQLVLNDKITKEDLIYYEDMMSVINGPEVVKMIECKHCSKRSKTTTRIGGIEEMESQSFKAIKKVIKNEPIWVTFLSKIKGIGPVLAAGLIKWLGYCEDAETVSQIWAYTGNHVVDGMAPKRKRGQLLGYNQELHTFTWLLSDTLMKVNKGYYRDLYVEEKANQLAKTYEKGFLPEHYNGYEKDDIQLSKGHAHNRALRKVRKQFLAHYWECSRELMNLPCKKLYIEGVKPHSRIIDWREAVKRES